MSPSLNRKYIRCEPIAGIWAQVYALPGAMKPLRYEPVALLYRESYHTPDGLLVLTPTGYMHYMPNGGVRSIDQRKVLAALDSMALREKKKAEGKPVESVLDEADRLLAYDLKETDDEQ